MEILRVPVTMCFTLLRTLFTWFPLRVQVTIVPTGKGFGMLTLKIPVVLVCPVSWNLSRKILSCVLRSLFVR